MSTLFFFLDFNDQKSRSQCQNGLSLVIKDLFNTLSEVLKQWKMEMKLCKDDILRKNQSGTS